MRIQSRCMPLALIGFCQRGRSARCVAGGMVTRLCEGRFGITRREWRVPAVLVKEQGILPSQLAERAQLGRDCRAGLMRLCARQRLACSQARCASNSAALRIPATVSNNEPNRCSAAVPMASR